MSDKTGIEWTDASWNPIAGCSAISPGCTHCYAATMARRLEAMGQTKYAGTAERRGKLDVFTGRVNIDESALTIPLRWKKPRRIFVNSMSDLFHEAVPDRFIDSVFAIMSLAPQHIFQVLTKRPERIAQYLARRERCQGIKDAARTLGYALEFNGISLLPEILPNVWLGTSIEDQKRADERIPHLVAAPAAVRFLSIEPLLGPIDLPSLSRISWIVVGSESGRHARPMNPNWVRAIREECLETSTPFFFKQWGEWMPIADLTGGYASERVGKKAAGRLLDGQQWSQFPGRAIVNSRS